MNSHSFRLVIVLFVLLFSAVANAAVSAGKVRLQSKDIINGNVIDLTGEWLYKPGYALDKNEAPQSVGTDRGYVRISVPQFLNRIHWWLDDSEDFNKAETKRLSKLGFDTDRAEDGWYRLSVDLPKLPAGKRVFLEFDGVAMKSEVFCNGERLGTHDGMFSRFEFDLTPHVREGRNVLSVFVSMEKIPASSLSQGTAVTVNLTASKVMTMSKGMFGPLSPGYDNRAYDLHGIWQPVRLSIRGTARLNDVWFIPSTNSAQLKIEASAIGNNQPAVIQARWTDKQTGKVFVTAEPFNVMLSSTTSVHTIDVKNLQPKLWTPAHPNLYRLDVKLSSSNGEPLDSWTHDVGFRTFEVRGNKLFLNGHPWWLRGANHLPYGKNPWDPQLAQKLIRELHQANINITRTHATPWNEAWLNSADEIGLGVSVEGIRPWALAGKIGATPDKMFRHWLMENEDVIRRCRNHPSVLIYTVGNEMMLRDSRNPDKWQQLSDVVKATRRTDPTRPVICSSEYQRETDVYEDVLKPHGFDDGDIDDVHRYFGWYKESPFVLEDLFSDEFDNNWNRPFIGQEISSGYPDLDDGLPVLRYTRDLATPQAWVGHYAYPKQKPDIFLQHHSIVTKRLAEQLRFQRGDKTAGFMLFAAECWFRHSFDARSVAPYPVLAAMKEAFAPIGLALETRRRRFFPGEQIETAVFVTNDDNEYHDVANAVLTMEFLNANNRPIFNAARVTNVDVKYYETKRVPVQITVPNIQTDRRILKLLIRLMNGDREISRTTEDIEVLAASKARVNARITKDAAPEIQRFVRTHLNQFAQGKPVIVIGAHENTKTVATGGAVRREIENGATAIWLSPGDKATDLFPEDIVDARETHGEFADWWPVNETKLTEKLQPMDIKWWARNNDSRVFVASSSHRLTANTKARSLITFIPSHSYISTDKVPEQFRTVLFEIPIGKGRLWICDLDLESSINVDPAAQLFASNLFRAAADPKSTSKLVKIPTHEQMLKRSR